MQNSEIQNRYDKLGKERTACGKLRFEVAKGVTDIKLSAKIDRALKRYQKVLDERMKEVEREMKAPVRGL